MRILSPRMVAAVFALLALGGPAAGQALITNVNCSSAPNGHVSWPTTDPVWEMDVVRPPMSSGLDGSGLEIRDVSEAASRTSFNVFSKAFGEGGVVRAIVVPGGASATRSRLDAWGEIAKRGGLPGLLTLKRSGGALAFQVKSVPATEVESLAAALDLRDGDLALLAAGPAGVVAPALGALRLELGRQLELVAGTAWEFLWVTEFPLLEWHAGDALHRLDHRARVGWRLRVGALLEVGARAERRALVTEHDDAGRFAVLECLVQLVQQLARECVAVVLRVERDRDHAAV